MSGPEKKPLEPDQESPQGLQTYLRRKATLAFGKIFSKTSRFLNEATFLLEFLKWQLNYNWLDRAKLLTR